MHTFLVISGGLLLLGVFLLVGRMMGTGDAPVLGRWALWFIPAWFIGAAINMWIGVSRAGYSMTEELPIFMVVFAVPAVIAALLWWWLAKG